MVPPLDPVERVERLVAMRGGDVRHEPPAACRHQEVEVPDLGGEAIVREVGDRFQLAEIVRARGCLHDEGEGGCVRIPRPPPCSARRPALPWMVVTIGIERIEGEGEPPRAGLRQAPSRFSVIRRRWCRRRPTVRAPPLAGQYEDVAPQERLAACQDRHAFRREAGDFVDHPETFLGAELAPIGEILGADERRAAGVEIAVLAHEVATIGEVPGDDVGPGE